VSKRRARGGTRVLPTPATAPARDGRGRLGPIRLGASRRTWGLEGLRAFALRRPVLASLLVFAAVAAVTRFAAWNNPLFEDPAQNLYVGQAIFDGGAPYVDAANNKGPLTYVLFGFLGLVSGTSAVVLRMTALVFTAFAALLVAGYVSRYAGRTVAFLAGLVFAVFSSTGDMIGYEPMTEVYGVVPMTAAWYLASRGGARSAAGAGVCAAVAALMNPAFGLVIPIAVLELWRRGRENGTLAKLFGLAVAGGSVVTALVLLWLGLAGALDDMFTQVVGFIFSNVDNPGAPISTQGRRSDTSELFRFVTTPAGGLWIAAIVGSVLAFRSRALRPLAIPSLLWLGLTFVRVKIADYELLHQFFLALPGIAVGLAGGIATLWGATLRNRVALAALVLAAPVATLVIGPQWRAQQLSPSERFGAGNTYALAEPVADFIRENTAPEDRIFVGGHNAQVYWLADRRAPTRFFDYFPVLYESAYRRERDRDLRSDPPKAIVIMPDTPPDNALRNLLVTRRYQLAFERGGAQVFLKF
jgi:hypothetical protein